MVGPLSAMPEAFFIQSNAMIRWMGYYFIRHISENIKCAVYKKFFKWGKNMEERTILEFLKERYLILIIVGFFMLFFIIISEIRRRIEKKDSTHNH